jgi:hypothetical protein
VPEVAIRDTQEEFHTGVSFLWRRKYQQDLTIKQRGGAGNVYKEKYGGHSRSPDRQGLGDKIKQALHLDKDKKHEPSPLTNETTTN